MEPPAADVVNSCKGPRLPVTGITARYPAPGTPENP
jgi:hypothetical protein